MTNFQLSIGVTRSYSSRPFLCALGKVQQGAAYTGVSWSSLG